MLSVVEPPSLQAGVLAALATVRYRYAQTITMGASMGEIMDEWGSPFLRPVLQAVLPQEYQKWGPVVLSYGFKWIGVCIAWTMQSVMSAMQVWPKRMQRHMVTSSPNGAVVRNIPPSLHRGVAAAGTRAGTADKEEGHSKAGEATRTAGTGNQNGADGGACAWEAATIKGMAWPASPVATGCQGNPCSTGISWGMSPAAQMGCLRNRSGSPSGADQP